MKNFKNVIAINEYNIKIVVLMNMKIRLCKCHASEPKHFSEFIFNNKNKK